MNKEITLIGKKDGVETHAYILVYDDTDILKDFYNRLNIKYTQEASFVYKDIDGNNHAYILRTSNKVTESTLRPQEFLDKIYGIVNYFGTNLLPENDRWSIAYIAKQCGINIKWNCNEISDIK